MKTQNTLKIILILIAGLSLVACGANKSVDFSVNPSGSGVNPALIDPNSALSYCNGINSPNVNGRVKSFVNQYGTITPDGIEIAIDSNLDQVLSGGQVMKFYDWYVNPDGSTNINPTPLNVVVKDYQSGQIITGYWPEVSQAMVNEYTRVHYQSSTSVGSFMQGKALVINGIGVQYQVLRVSVQNGSQEMSHADSLIPSFLANPNTYALNHGPVLQALHPNGSIAAQHFTDQQYLQNLLSYCF